MPSTSGLLWAGDRTLSERRGQTPAFRKRTWMATRFFKPVRWIPLKGSVAYEHFNTTQGQGSFPPSKRATRRKAPQTGLP